MAASDRCRLESSERMMESVERRDDPLAEIDLTEEEIDAMMAEAEPVDIAGPPQRRRGSRFQLYKDTRGEFRWRLWSSSGMVLATGGDGYATRQAAIAGINAVRREAPDAALVE